MSNSSPDTSGSTKAVDLLPCPFCGGPAGVESREDYFVSRCVKCGATGRASSSEDRAGHFWNKRTAPEPAAVTATCPFTGIYRLQHKTEPGMYVEYFAREWDFVLRQPETKTAKP